MLWRLSCRSSSRAATAGTGGRGLKRLATALLLSADHIHGFVPSPLAPGTGHAYSRISGSSSSSSSSSSRGGSRGRGGGRIDVREGSVFLDAGANATPFSSGRATLLRGGGSSSSTGGDGDGLLAVHVFGTLKPSSGPTFWESSVANSKGSMREEGVARFDVLKGLDDPDTFCLIEVYKDADAPAAHKETAHYAGWRDAVAELMAEPRRASKYTTLFPGGPLWDVEASASEGDAGQAVAAAMGVEAEGESAGAPPMLAVLVDVQVKPGMEEAFILHTLDNCRNSVREGGIHRFDLLRGVEDSSNFVLVEVYNSEAGPAAHKETPHYLRWRDAVADMMARPRGATKFVTVFPHSAHWHRTEAISHAQATMSPANKPTSFEFGSPGRLVFGEGSAAQVPSIAKGFDASKPLIVTGARGAKGEGSAGELVVAVQAAFGEDKCRVVSVTAEPTIGSIQAGLDTATAAGCDIVIGIGGGSVVDAGKALACLLANEGDVMDYIEVVGRGKKVSKPSLPYIAVPTTAGTGSEVTKNAAVKAEEQGIKASIRSPYMMPDVAVVDPFLTVSASPLVTACTGLDALTQCIEPFVSCKANPFTDAFAREGIIRAARSIRSAYRDGSDMAARQDMALASVMGGYALANAKLGAVHGFAGVLGGVCEEAPHGAICARLLPFVFAANVKALREAGPEYAEALARHEETARLITGSPTASPEEGVAWLSAVAVDLCIPGLSAYGLQPSEWAKVASLAAGSSSMAGNPIPLSEEVLGQILADAS